MTQTNRNNEPKTVQRDWHDLKPGDVIWLANGWFEVFDATPCGRDIVKVKITVKGHIETYNVRTSNHKATCQA